MTEIDYKAIELLVLDVDGVMTDGRIILSPSGEESKEFHVRDGSGMKVWRRLGKKIAIITGRASPAVELRARDLGVDAIKLGAKEKLPAYRSVLDELGVKPSQAAVMGDDLPDLPLLQSCALPIAVADAVEEAKVAAAYTTRAKGGKGAVREAIELILKNAGLWQQVLHRYTSQRLQGPTT